MTHAEGADTLIGILREATDAGFAAVFTAHPDGRVACGRGNCRAESAAHALDISHYRRLEGASDAADMLLVAMARCPVCGAGGTLTLGYGPNADADDADVLADLDLRDVASGPLS